VYGVCYDVIRGAVAEMTRFDEKITNIELRIINYGSAHNLQLLIRNLISNDQFFYSNPFCANL